MRLVVYLILFNNIDNIIQSNKIDNISINNIKSSNINNSIVLTNNNIEINSKDKLI